jgi:hypothetical protein
MQNIRKQFTDRKIIQILLAIFSFNEKETEKVA